MKVPCNLFRRSTHWQILKPKSELSTDIYHYRKLKLWPWGRLILLAKILTPNKSALCCIASLTFRHLKRKIKKTMKKFCFNFHSKRRLALASRIPARKNQSVLFTGWVVFGIQRFLPLSGPSFVKGTSPFTHFPFAAIDFLYPFLHLHIPSWHISCALHLTLTHFATMMKKEVISM